MKPQLIAMKTMLLATLIAFPMLLPAVAHEGPQTFTSAADGRQLVAVIVGRSESSVSLRRVADGRVFVLRLEALTEPDRARIRNWTPPATASNDVGNRVLAYSQAHLGKKAGGGECAHLAVEALKAAGAGGRQPDFPNRGDYVWGRLVANIRATQGRVEGMENFADIQPGDIVQLRDVRFVGRRGCRGTYRSHADHHTVVIERIDPANGVLHILHQNVNGVRRVMRDTYRIHDLQQGWLRVYRPVAAGG